MGFETPIMLAVLRLAALAWRVPEQPVALEAYCQAVVRRGFLHCGCTSDFLEAEFTPGDARLVIDLLSVSYTKDRGDEPAAARVYRTYSVHQIDRVAAQLFSARHDLANACPLNFETAD